MSNTYGKMQECWVIFRCSHVEMVDGQRVQCPVTARRNAFRGAVYHKHGTERKFMEPVALAVVGADGIAGGANVTQEPVVDEADVQEDVQNGYAP